jgi:hypothetical protein
MTAALRRLAGEDADARGTVAAAAVVLLEGLLLIVVAGFIPRAVGAHGEIPSAAAVLVLLAAGALFAHRLSEADLPGEQRWLLGVVVSVVALQVVGRVDLSETWRVWSFGWAADVSDPDSGAWSGSQRLDHVLGMAVLTFAWFRGVALGSSDLAGRSLAPLLPVAVLVFVAGFLAGDGAQIIDRVRIAALAFLAVGLLAVAFRNAQRLTAGGSFGAVGLTFASTLGAMLVAAIVFMLIVTLLVATVAGSGVAEPVTDTLGWLLRNVAIGVAWVVWTLLWPLRQLIGSGAPPIPPQEVCFLNELGELECIAEPQRSFDFEQQTGGDDGAGAVAFRVFAGIGLVLGVTILAALLFRQVWRRRRAPDEERESLWSEADPLGDLWSGLRSLGERLRPRRGAAPEPGIGGLYLEMLADAERRGTRRPTARTPRQFAPALERLYASPVPGEISERFNEQRYAGREPPADDVARLRDAFASLREAQPG